MTRFYSDEQEKEIVEEYFKEGETLSTVADKYYISANTVKEMVKRQGKEAKVTKYSSKKIKEKSL